MLWKQFFSDAFSLKGKVYEHFQNTKHLEAVNSSPHHFFEMGSCYVAQASLSVAILLPQPLSAVITGIYHHT
jgi:hypothetical protein